MTDKEQPTKAIVPFREPSGGDAVKAFIPNDFSSVFRFAELLAESGDMVPKAYIGNPAKISTAIFFGYEIGLLPLQALQSIAVINGKPSIYGDAALALVRASGLLEDFEETYEGEMFDAAGKPNQNYKAVCKVTRKGAKRATVSEFSIGEAMMANLWNKEGPWRAYAKRMLKMRARGFALRDEFTDILRGLVLAEEAQDYDDMVDVTPAGEKQPPVPDGDADESAADSKPRRGRPRKADAQAAAAASASGTEGKTIEGTAERGPAGDAAKAEDVKPAAAVKAAETAPKDDGVPLIIRIVPDFKSLPEQLRLHITKMHEEMAPTTDLDAMKEVFKKYWKSWTPSADPEKKDLEDDRLKTVRDFHKERVAALPPKEEAKAEAGDNPPDPDGDGVEFDFGGWLAELTEGLAAAKTPDEVGKIHQAFTEIPMANSLLSDEQVDQVTALTSEHMRRTEADS